ncbi:hypothetical protein KEJ47_09440 [Candidatus Bathyarchaeota archaeon]|nr:hypothetical protein [Candidatus Bathyarchaeota archaeon]
MFTIFTNVGQIIQTGRAFQLVFLLIIGALGYVSYYLGKKGKTWEIRPLEGLEATYEGIGRAAEMGRPIMVLPGISDLGNPQTLAGLTVLGEVAQQSAEIGVTAITSASNPGVITAEEAIIRSSYTAAGKPELYSPGKYVRWFGGDQFAYAVGAAGQILGEKPAVIVYMGYFLFDVIVDGETGNRIGAVQIGGTLGSMDMVALFCDNILIGEELYAASASITRDKIAVATIAGQDWIKLITLGIMILGVIFSLAGSKVIWEILGR